MNAIRIRRISARVTTHAIRPDRIIVSPAGAHDESRFVEVTVHGEDDVRGYGEGAVLPMWTGETADTAKMIIETVFAPRLIDAEVDHPRDALDVMDALLYWAPATKAAVDTAIWDLWAKQQNVPAWKLFADRPLVTQIPSRFSLGCYDVPKTVALAREIWSLGIRTLKFKVGMPAFNDADRLKAVREELGDEPIFTVDVNAGYPTADAAVRAIEPMLPYNLDLVEQPTPRDRFQMLAEVRKRVPVTIMADELIFSPAHLDEALQCDAFDLLSVYPGKNGGVTRSLEMVATAQAAGKRCCIGSCAETDIGQAAMAMLAGGLSAFDIPRYANDFIAALYYDESAAKVPLTFQDGTLTVPDGVGFGVEPRD